MTPLASWKPISASLRIVRNWVEAEKRIREKGNTKNEEIEAMIGGSPY